ncbi:hypothetical protein PIROE2DRAFT_15428 [Piromyces sp. E2]|nr:hypothetical protein PIROE2DRAFT_15428 [Piromyces sp. E2]|eukprot:OUM59123.1 hypothetical protein PIROE2DRAFT_15428 [Piromyces sp. E2]
MSVIKHNNKVNLIDNKISTPNTTPSVTKEDNDSNAITFIDVEEKLAVKQDDSKNSSFLEEITSLNLEQCKMKCIENHSCHWLQHDDVNNNCYLYTYKHNNNNNENLLFHWRYSNSTVQDYTIERGKEDGSYPVTKEEECHKRCKLLKNSICLYSVYSKVDNKAKCQLYNIYENKNYTLSFFADYGNRLELMKEDKEHPVDPEEGIMKNEEEENTGEDYPIVFAVYGSIIILLVLVVIVIFFFKKRNDNEKMLLYTLSHGTMNSQSKSRSRSSPSENMSYLNSGSYLTSGSYINNGSYFGNTFNASSITINPDSMENQKHSKSLSHSGSNMKKSKRKSSSSKAPSVHSISTLGTNNNNTPNNQGDTTQNDKSHHNNNLSLSTKKSSYNYSIKTFSTKDPSLTGLSQNIKTLFANSYSGMNDTNSYYDTFSTLSTGSPKVELSSYDNVLYKDNVSSSSIKNIYGQHKKQNSSISITIPKISNNNSVNVSSKNNHNGNSPQQAKVIKIKKPVHTKQFSISKSVYSEPALPLTTTSSEISLHDDLDGISYIEQDQISFNANNTIPTIAIVNNNTTNVK